MHRVAIIVVTLVLVVAAPPTAAQAPGAGFWLEGGLGIGWARVACDLCDPGRPSGVAGHLALGGQLGTRIRLGAEADLWRSSGAGVPERLITVSALAQWHLVPTLPVRAKAGVGYTSYRVHDDADVVTASGVGPVLGLASEWRVSDRVGLGPYATLVIGTIGGQVSFNGTRVQDSANLTLLHVGVAATWR